MHKLHESCALLQLEKTTWVICLSHAGGAIGCGFPIAAVAKITHPKATTNMASNTYKAIEVFLCFIALLITNVIKANTATHSRAKTMIEISCVYLHIQSHSFAKFKFAELIIYYHA